MFIYFLVQNDNYSPIFGEVRVCHYSSDFAE